MIILVAKCGAGKSTVEKELAKKGFKRVVGYTTRDIRKGEIDGVDYNFVDKKTFDNLEHIGYFARAIRVDGDCYATALKDCNNKNSVISLGFKGCQQLLNVLGKSGAFVVYIKVDEASRLEKLKLRSDFGQKTLDRIRSESTLKLVDEIEYDLVIDNYGFRLKPQEIVEKILNSMQTKNNNLASQ